MLNIVELYSGTGRSAEPFRRSRSCKVKLLVDCNEDARDNYLHNHPKATYELRNIGSNTNGAWVREKAGGRVDVLLGCPPCQGFSDAGARDESDRRNSHLAHFARIAVEVAPSMIAMENVPGAALSPQFFRLIDRLEQAGYRIVWDVLNSAHYGSAQSRQRLVLFAAHKRLKKTPIIPNATHGSGRYFSYALGRVVSIEDDPIGILGITPTSGSVLGRDAIARRVGRRPMMTVGQALQGLPKCGTAHAAAINHIAWAHTSSMIERMSQVPEGGRHGEKDRYFSQAYGRLHRLGLARTITTNFPNPGSGRFWHPTQQRTLTLREAARLQGFGDRYKFNGLPSHDAVLVGNALDAALADLKYRVIRETIA